MRKAVAALCSAIGRPFGLSVRKTGDIERLEKRAEALRDIVTSRMEMHPSDGAAPIGGVVFSKDRALQLDALLSSFQDMAAQRIPLYVLFAASSARHRKAYEEVFEIHRPLLSRVEEQSDFRRQTISLIDALQTRTILFLVDDIVFVRPIDFEAVARIPCDRFVVSLRLAPHLRRSYTLDTEQPAPRLLPHESGLFMWKWSEGMFDWNYPLSLDGHLFDRNEFRVMTRHSSFWAPNSYEQSLQDYREIFLPRFGACFAESRIVNIPINKVQRENENRFGGVHQDELLEKWERGMRMEYRALYGVKNVSAHEELALSFVRRS